MMSAHGRMGHMLLATRGERLEVSKGPNTAASLNHSAGSQGGQQVQDSARHAAPRATLFTRAPGYARHVVPGRTQHHVTLLHMRV